MNSERVLDKPFSETLWRLSFVTTTVTAALFVFTATEPKLRELGATPTAAWAGMGIDRAPAKSDAKHRHTNSVLFMSG